MKALILAAGDGKRLRPLTYTTPKGMIPVNGVPMLVNALSQIEKIGIKSAVIVVGHLKEKIYDAIGRKFGGVDITYVENKIYDKTNNVYSLWLARNYLNDDALMLECDLFYKENLIGAICSGRSDCDILVSPFDPKTMDGTVVEVDASMKVKCLTAKQNQGEDYDYSGKLKTVNIYRFSKSFLQDKFLPFIDLYVRTQSVNSFYELVLGGLVYLGNSDIKAISVPADWWCEVDAAADLKRACEMFK